MHIIKSLLVLVMSFSFLLINKTLTATEISNTSAIPNDSASPNKETTLSADSPAASTDIHNTPKTEEENSLPSQPTLALPILPPEFHTRLSEELIFKQAEQVFMFGSHAEQAGVLKRLLRHYQKHLQELKALETSSKQTHTEELSPSNKLTETSTSETLEPASKPSISTTLYRYYYKPILAPLFINEQKPEISLALLDWITELNLTEEIVFIENVLKHSETKKTATSLSLNLKNKALRALETFDIDTPESLSLLKSYLTNEKVNLGNNRLIESAAAALSGKGGLSVKKELKKIFETTSQNDLKITILRSLSQFQDPKDVDFLINILESREADSIIWTALVELMHYPNSQQAETTLLNYVKEEDIKLSARAIYALSAFTNETVYQTLLEATKNNNPIARSEALKALSKQKKHKEDILELLPLLQYKNQYDSDSLVKKTAREILEQHELPLEESP